MGDNERAREQAKAQLDSIKEMVAALECDWERLEELQEERDSLQWDYDNAEEGDEKTAAAQALLEWGAENGEEYEELKTAAGDCKDYDQARERIEQDALSVQVRGDWHSPGESDGSEPTEFEILLCIGGPAVKIVGDLDRGQPSRPRLMYQDWFTAWEEYTTTGEDNDALETYCSCFWFGD